MDSLPAAVRLSKAEELNSKGAQFFKDGHMEPARLHFLAALMLEPDQPQVLQNLGAVLRNMGHLEASESCARRSVALSGNNAFCRSNLGVAQLGLKKHQEALITLRSVCRDLPEHGPSWHNYGLALYTIGQYEDALASFDKSFGYGYSNAQVKSDRALTLLSLGRIDEGLAAYETRWDLLAKSKMWQLGVREWQGESLQGRHILVHHEQGFGDSLMLVRFAKLLMQQNVQITLAVPESLVVLFTKSFPSISVIDWDTLLPEEDHNYDFHSPLLSVMRWTGITVPKEIDASPYLKGDPARFLNVLPDAKLRVGICWASGNHGPALRERRRVVDLISFLSLIETKGVSLVSLQVGTESSAISANGMEGMIFDLSYKLENFNDTADLISSLDLVISVDSAVAHVAGALGKTCLMLSPFSRCWRWWNKTSGWPWYERMAIFHQSSDGKWDEAVRNATRAVQSYMAERE